MAPDFVPGLELSRLFYVRAVRPVLDAVRPGLIHSAGRVGSGSEVLGFDTPRSADHEWGPRLQLFLSAADLSTMGKQLDSALSEHLPATFLGWPTHFEPADAPIRHMAATDGPVRHRIDLVTVAGFATERLGFDPSEEVNLLDWLSTPWQRFAELTAGAVFHDGLRELEPLRRRLAWPPDDVWRYVLACQWQRLAEEEAFPGRCHEVGDELGARIETARLVRIALQLRLLMDRRYPPYAKWLGSAGRRWIADVEFLALLDTAMSAAAWSGREAALGQAYSSLVRRHNELNLTAPIEDSTRPYHERPFVVIHADRIADALRAGLVGTRCGDLPPCGGVDQMIDNTALAERAPQRRGAIAAALGLDQ